MKRMAIFIMVTALILSMGIVVFAETTDNGDAPQWFTEMIQWKKDQLKEAVDSNTITEDQAKFFNERIEYMEKFHGENGFDFPAGCAGGGFGGRGYGGGPRGLGRGMGFQSY